jgi:hypothetical protein
MKKILIAGMILLLLILSAGCVAQPDENSPYTDKDGNILTGDETEGSILFIDGSKTEWFTDSEGNIRYTATEPDGTVIKYYTTPEGETILEV